MNISLDAGALCVLEHSFGTATFARNLLDAFSRYDKKNEYIGYTFCSKNDRMLQSDNLSFKQLLPKQFWMKGAVSAEELLHPKDIFLALNQAIPLFTKSRIFSFSHGLSFLKYPEYYPKSCNKLRGQLDEMIRRSEIIFVSSSKVKEELLKFAGQTPEVVVAPFGVPIDMISDKEWNPKDYFLYVGMDAPIKNISFLIESFKSFQKQEKNKHLKLYLVGNFDESKIFGENVIVYKSVSRSKLRDLYLSALSLLSTSHYESFNFPAVEATSLGCPVIGLLSSIIPELTSFVNQTPEVGFVALMNKAARRELQKAKSEEIRKKFTWKSYVETIQKYY